MIAYSPCIAHGYGLGSGLDQQKLAVDTGYWPLYRFDPQRVDAGEPGLKLDSPPPSVPLEKFWANETRFQSLTSKDSEISKHILESAQTAIAKRYATLQPMAGTRTMEGQRSSALKV